MSTKMKKVIKICKLKILKKEKKLSGDMVVRELQTKFDLDPHTSFQETRVYRRNGQRTPAPRQ